ncbi:MAG TPA: hypothetical protein VHD87_16885 [Acidimicrobiales bacterium]|nr:hypothetical protein [Acidimicrobiales bacterium]HVV37334.1 hypothetical protein [Acidimicrobiales bacterium]
MNFVTLAAVVALLASCSNGGDKNADKSSKTRATTTTAPADHEVLTAYRAFWDDYLAAADPMDPQSPKLGDHATDPELQTLRTAFLARKSGGEVIRGNLNLSPRVLSILGESASVRDCYLDNTGIYDAATGTRKDTATGVRHLITASLVRDAGAWKVSNLKREGDGCTAA